jgi:hypothetical protein
VITIHCNLFQPWAFRCVPPPTKKKPKSIVNAKPPWRTTCNSSKSPIANNVNSLLAEINRQKSCYNSALTTLGSPSDQNKTGDDGLDNLRNLVPPLDKNIQINPPVSLTSINHCLDSPTTSIDKPTIKSPQAQPPSPNRVVLINKTSTPAVSDLILSTTSQSPNPTPQSMHQSSPSAINPTTEVDINPSKSQPKENHDCSEKLLHLLSKDHTKEIYYHLADFAVLHPVWPIIEFSMSPTETSKDESMINFAK